MKKIPTQMLLTFLPPPVPAAVTPQLQNAYRTLAEACNRKPDAPTAIAKLGLKVSATPTQAEVQSIADKLDEVLGALQS